MWKARIVQKILGKSSDDSLPLKDFFGPQQKALRDILMSSKNKLPLMILDPSEQTAENELFLQNTSTFLQKKVHFPDEKCIFLQRKNALSCRRKNTFLQKKSGFDRHCREPQEIARGFQGSRIKNASQLSQDDASRQKLTPHCLAAIFDSQLPSPKLSLKMPPKLPLPHKRGFFLLSKSPPQERVFSSFKITPAVSVIAGRLSGKSCRGNLCLAALRCLSWPSGQQLEKVQGATRFGATGLRASEREICL